MSIAPQLMVAVLETTHRCNLHCRHCGSACTNEDFKDELSIIEWQSIIRQFADLEVEKIIFSGGEPFLKPDFDQLIEFTSDLNIPFGIISNGLHIPDEYLELLVDYPPFAIGISIDGEIKTHNFIRQNSKSYAAAMESIRKIKAIGLPPVVNTTVSKLNYRELPAIAESLEFRGVLAWQIQLAMPMGRMSEFKDELLDQNEFDEVCRTIATLRRQYSGRMKINAADCFGMDVNNQVRVGEWPGCTAGIYALGVKANGEVLPCLSLKLPEFVVGDLRIQSLREIWEDDWHFKFNRDFNQSEVDKNSRCKGCIKLTDCRGGCASMSYTFNNRLHDSPFCVDRDINSLGEKKTGKGIQMENNSNKPFNAINILRADLENHEVKVINVGGNGAQPPLHDSAFFLIVTQAKSCLADEFLETFGTELEKLARKFLSNESDWREYGVLIDHDLQMIFAFNMQFADYDRESGRIVYKDPQDILAEAVNKQETTEPDLPLPIRPWPPRQRPDSSNITFRYALPDPGQSE